MAYDVTDFSDIVSAVAAELKLDTNDTAEMTRIKRDINLIYRDEVVPFKRWKWLLGHTTLRQQPFISDGTVAVTPGSTTITFSVAPTESATGKQFALDNFNEIYTISAHTAASTTATISSQYTGTLQSAATYKLWSNKLALPTDCRETIEVYHDHMAQPMEGLGLQDFRRRNVERPKFTGRPLYYTTYDFEDPSTGTAETESDRYRVLMVYPAIYEYSTTLHVDYIKEITALDSDGDEPIMPIEDRIVLVYGALSRAWRRARNPEEAATNQALFDRKLALMAGKVEDSQDKPQITPNSTYLARKRARPNSSLNSSGSFSSGASYTAPNYLSNARIDGASITGTVTVSSGITIDGRDISADGALLDAHIADTSDAHDASAISVVPVGDLTSDTVQEALEELQGDINAINSNTGLADHLVDTSDAHDASAISVVPTGNLAADDVQEALQELQGDVDGLNTSVTDHINDAVDAHDASAISVSPSGNLASTDVQAALSEIQGDIDSHLSDATDAHDASAISSVPSGNLAATDVQTALNELQTDIDTRALASDLTNHLSDTIDAHDASAISFVAGGTIAATDVQAAISEVATDAASALSTHEADTSTHGVATVAGLSETQQFSNKDYDGGTASNTSRITLPKATKSTLDGLNRKEATIVYATDTAKAYIDNGSSLVAVGSGSGDGINYITDGDAESALAGTTYKDAAQNSPVDGTGGSPSITWTRSASSPIRGSQSYLLTKPASNCQGEGVAIPFTHPGMVEVNQVEFEYNVNSGSYTTGYLRIYAVDVTTGAVIEPVNVEVQNVGVTSKHIATFQTTLNSTSYRLCLHVADSSSNAWSLKVDSIRCGPQVTTQGAFISDWTSYTPTVTYSSGGATNVTHSGRWRRVGDSIELEVRSLFSSTSAAFTQPRYSLPSGLSFDTAKMTVGTTNQFMGTSVCVDSGSNSFQGDAQYFSSNTFLVNRHITQGGASPFNTGTFSEITNTGPFTFNNGDWIQANIRAPISGWGSSVSIAGADSGRVCAFRMFRGSTSQTISSTSATAIQFNTVSVDTHGGCDVTTNYRYDIKVSGYYVFTASAYVASFTANEALGLAIRRNGSEFASRFFRVPGTDLIESVTSAPIWCSAGEYIDATLDSAADNSYTVQPSSAATFLSGFLIQAGNQAITAAETVAAVYTNALADTMTASTTTYLDFGTKVRDTHNAVLGAGGGNKTVINTGWRFISPVSGFYRLSVITGGSWSSGTNVDIGFAIDGSAVGPYILFPVSSSVNNVYTVSGTVYLNVGQRVEVGAFSGATGTRLAQARFNYVSIERVGG